MFLFSEMEKELKEIKYFFLMLEDVICPWLFQREKKRSSSSINTVQMQQIWFGFFVLMAYQPL